jgi:excisionase family DNA binding protein
MNDDTPRLIGTAEAAALLGVTRRQVQKLIGRKWLRARRLGRDWRVYADSVAEAAHTPRPKGRPRKNINP